MAKDFRVVEFDKKKVSDVSTGLNLNECSKPVIFCSEMSKGKEEFKGWKVFEVGEEIIIKEQKFKVRKVTSKDLILRPVKDMEKF